MADGKPRPTAEGFLPHRSETLRESFQEKMRQKGSLRSGRNGGLRGEISLLEMAHGPHPEVDSLNDRFHPGVPRLKATLEILGFEPRGDGIPPALLLRVLEHFPGLKRHRCCGDGGVEAGLFPREGGPDRPLAPGDAALALCHLLEHLGLELMGGMVPHRPCAAITCAYREPLHRFDLFLECDDARAGAAALRCSAIILLAFLGPGEAPPGAARYAETARYFLGRPRSVLNPGEVLADLRGEPSSLQAALRFLAAAGFLVENRFTFDFGETILYRYHLASSLPPLPLTLGL